MTGVMGAAFVWWIRLRLPESPRWLAQKGRIDEANAVMERLEGRVQVEYGRPLPTPAMPEPVRSKAKFRDLLAPPYRRRTLMLIIFHVFGVNAVLVFISGAMLIVILAIATLGTRTRDIALEDISK